MATRIERTAAFLSLAAGGIHGALTPDHFAVWWGYGLFFAAAAAAQVLWGLAIITDAIGPDYAGPNWRTWRQGLFVGGIAGNLLLLAMYVVSRTNGVPFAGPEEGEVEPVGVLDVVEKALEVTIIALCLVALRQPGKKETPPT